MDNLKKIVLLGFKGDCSGRNYNKVLFEMASAGKINLICVDFGVPKNVLDIPKKDDVLKLIKSGRISYLDLKKSEDVEAYKKLDDIEVVFVVTPDITHCRLAADFLGKAQRIFIDKPIDSILRNVRSIEGFSGIEKTVFAYDHYLSKFYPFQLKTDQWLKEKIIGDVERIEFRLLETSSIPRHRVSALDRGMIYDLFSHGLAVVVAIPNKWAYPDNENLRKLKIEKVSVAKYAGCKTHGCSYAKIIFSVFMGDRFIPCEAVVGKGVGQFPEKNLKIVGSQGEIVVDINKYDYHIAKSNGEAITGGNLVHDYAGSFLSAATDLQKQVFEIPGAMPFDAGKEILFILDEAEWRRKPEGKMPNYPVGSSVEAIERIINNKLKPIS